VVGLSLELDQISATYLSKAVEELVKPKYAADANAGKSPEDKISQLAASVSRLAKQVRPQAPDNAFYTAFTIGGVAAAQDVILFDFRANYAELNNRCLTDGSSAGLFLCAPSNSAKHFPPESG
jgi:hypothetical protein